MNTATMNLTTIDTLAFSKRMQRAGLEQKISDELAEALKDSHSQSIENFATKDDLEIKINQSESKLERRIDQLELKIGKMIYLATGVIISAIGLAVAFLKI